MRAHRKALRGESRLVRIEQETLLSEYRGNSSATYTTTVRQCDKETIRCKDNKVYMLASPNNKETETIATRTITGYTKAVA